MITDDILFVKGILPDTYSVNESKRKGSIHCTSEIGIRKTPYLNKSSGKMVDDEEDESRWDSIFLQLKSHFGERFQEVFHNTCFCHVDFTIYLRVHELD